MQRAAEHRGDNGNLVWRDHYQYDRYGNRWQSSTENVGRPYVPINPSDYEQATNRFNEKQGEYDAAGNLTVDSTFGDQSHVYDAKGRAVSTTSLATQQVVSSAVYDGLGQRVQTTEGSVTRRQVYEASGMVLTEYENGVLKRDCIYANGELVATEEPANGKRYHLNDQQGSARVVTDNNGLVTARHDYFPFGEEIGLLGQRQSSQGYGAADGNRKRYAGMEKDGPTGQDHTWFRKADTRAGRWTSPDPYGGSLSVNNPQSTNRYAYVENDSLNGVDPSGLNIAWIPRRSCVDIGDGPVCETYYEPVWFPGGFGGSLVGPGNFDPVGQGGGQQGASQQPQDQKFKDCFQSYKFTSMVESILGPTALTDKLPFLNQSPLDLAELGGEISFLADVGAMLQKARRTGVGGSGNRYASGFNAIGRQIARVASKEFGLDQGVLVGKVIKYGDKVTPVLAVSGVFTGFYNLAIAAQCLGGNLK